MLSEAREFDNRTKIQIFTILPNFFYDSVFNYRNSCTHPYTLTNLSNFQYLLKLKNYVDSNGFHGFLKVLFDFGTGNVIGITYQINQH